MNGLDWLEESWRFLSRDIPLVGGFQSLMLSWLCAAGILVLCFWQSLFLVRGVRSEGDSARQFDELCD